MANRFYGYQYDTNPRKLNVEYNPYVSRYSEGKRGANSQKNDNVKSKHEKRVTSRNKHSYNETSERYEAQKSINNNSKQYESTNVNYEKNKQNSRVPHVNKKARVKLVMMLLAGFSMLFVISYQNSLVSESFNKKENYKKELEALSKTNKQIEVNIENNLNLNNIEQVAKVKLGMQKLDNSQKIYVSLPKEDFVAPATEQVVIEENEGFFEKLVKGFTKSVK